MIHRFKIWFLEKWYGMKFEKGYTYLRMSNEHAGLLLFFHQENIDEGWEPIGDFQRDGNEFYFWYRKPTTQYFEDKKYGYRNEDNPINDQQLFELYIKSLEK